VRARPGAQLRCYWQLGGVRGLKQQPALGNAAARQLINTPASFSGLEAANTPAHLPRRLAPDTVALYLASRAGARKVSTLQRSVSGLSQAFLSHKFTEKFHVGRAPSLRQHIARGSPGRALTQSQ
jgi:hypothetical protein